MSSPDSDGLTIRDIVLETREDVKEIKAQIPHFVTWPKLAGAATAFATLAFAVINILR